MVGYSVPCRYCEALVDPAARFCPVCERVNPAGPLRCPVCRNPIRKQWAICSNCGVSLKVKCPACSEETFLADYCDHCQALLVVKCSNPKCGKEQPPVGDRCQECEEPLKSS